MSIENEIRDYTVKSKWNYVELKRNLDRIDKDYFLGIGTCFSEEHHKPVKYDDFLVDL